MDSNFVQFSVSITPSKDTVGLSVLKSSYGPRGQFVNCELIESEWVPWEEAQVLAEGVVARAMEQSRAAHAARHGDPYQPFIPLRAPGTW